MKIGITEAGDAGLDLTWTNKMSSVDGAILITKHITDAFIQKALKYKNKVIIHATCTGMGGSIIEPNVPTYEEQLSQLRKLIFFDFPEDQIVLRIDPIVPTKKGLMTAQKVIDASPVKRIRFSVLDCYPHVRERFQMKNIPLPYGNNFQAPDEFFDDMKAWISSQNPDISFECCAEPAFLNFEKVKCTGCVSEQDLKLLGLELDKDYIQGAQRAGCMCLSCKTELLEHKKKCPHGCLYCYWKD